MVAPLKRVSIRSRIWSIVLILIGSVLLSSVLDVVLLRAALQQEKEALIRQMVEGGHAVLAHFEGLERHGRLSRQAAQAAALSTVRAMRYDGKEYFWINDNQTPARMLMHPIMPEFEGGPLLGEQFKRATGLRSGRDGPFVPTDGHKNLTEAFVEVVAPSGQGYVTYPWPKTLADGGSTDESFPKLSYVKSFAPWGWIIGSGIYVDDIDTAVRLRATQNLMFLLGTSTALLLLASLIARSITRPLRTTMQAMREIVEEDAALGRRVAVDGPGEMAELASNFNQMLDYIQVRDQALLKHREHLEDEVAMRTASLREANLKLDAELAERQRYEKELQDKLLLVEGLNQQLEAAQNQLLQVEKMASIGQLAAGVAHEINNPIGFVRSNLGALAEYVEDMLAIIQAYGRADPLLGSQPELQATIAALKKRANLDFLSSDVPALLGESRQGIDRVARIVQDLKDFSRINSMDWAMADLEQGLDSTLNIVSNQFGAGVEVVKAYGGLPPVECLGSQMNQVFMNLLVNAGQAIERHGTITLRTGRAGDRVWIEVADTGKGIEPADQKRIFEPFFTTRPVGQGTGLGLSLAYSIVRKHHGSLAVNSEPGRGSCFRIELPLRQPQGQPASAQGALAG